MSIESICQEYGWKFSGTPNECIVELPSDPSIRLYFKRMPVGRHYTCSVNSEYLFKQVKKSFAVDVLNFAQNTFRSDVDFVDKGVFLSWLRMNVVVDDASKEFERFAECLRSQKETEQKSEVTQRKCQNLLRELLLKYEGGRCVISGVSEKELLIASHIKDWKSCEAEGGDERLDFENVLLLARNWDALFDKKFISFDPETGKMIKSERISEADLIKFGVPKDWRETVRIPIKTERRKNYLLWHLNAMREKDASCTD